MRVLITGAGIGGLTTAIALRRHGIAFEVFERAPVLREVGAGISLWPNAVKLLDRLGIGEQARRVSVLAYLGGIHRRDGRLLAPADNDELVREFGVPMLILHRADLLDILYRAADPDCVRLGATATRVTQDESGVRLHLDDGSEVSGDLLVGADGIRSAVRAQLFPDARPRFTGQMCWRGVTQFDAPAGASFWGESWGFGTRFGLLPLAAGRVYWFATRNGAEGQPDADGGRKAELLDLFADWHAPIGTLIESTAESAILRNDLYDLPALPRWSQGRVTLLGDAAHATTPNLGQGGCQAAEDAWELARELAVGDDVPSALRRYEAARVARANHITSLSRRVGAMGNWTNPWACRLRDRLTAHTPKRLRLAMLRPIVGYEPA